MHRRTTLAVGALLAALALTTAPEASAATLAREPYLQKVGPDAATVAFRLASDCSAGVRFGVGAATQTVRSEASGRVHAVALTGLSPGTEYSYQVDACGVLTSPRTFRTAPVPGTRSVHFAAVGDFGTGGTDQKAVSADILAKKPDVFIMLGDNAYESGTEQEFQDRLFAPMAALLAQVPFFATPGNHEYVTNQGQPYLDNLYLPTNNAQGSERYFSFDWGHVHFVSLDSNCAIGLASSDRCSLAAQKAWVEADLAGTTQPWKVVFFHHPIWSSGEHGSQLTMRRNFAPLFEKYGVDLVLTGHDHDYERSKPMKGDAVAASGEVGIPYVVVGGGGASLREFAVAKPSWSVIRDDQAHGFLDVDVTEGTLSAKLITTGGKVLDSFTLKKTLPPVQDPPPTGTLGLIVEGERGVAPHKALFRATPPVLGATVQWDFGDSTTSEGDAVEHTYDQAGQYRVTATSGGQTASAQVVVTTASGTPDSGTPTESSPDGGSTQPDTRPGLPGGSSDTGSGGGGCTAGGAMALLPAAAVWLAALRRRRQRR